MPRFEHHYADQLPDFYTQLQPTPLKGARLLYHSEPLARELGQYPVAEKLGGGKADPAVGLAADSGQVFIRAHARLRTATGRPAADIDRQTAGIDRHRPRTIGRLRRAIGHPRATTARRRRRDTGRRRTTGRAPISAHRDKTRVRQVAIIRRKAIGRRHRAATVPRQAPAAAAASPSMAARRLGRVSGRHRETTVIE